MDCTCFLTCILCTAELHIFNQQLASAVTATKLSMPLALTFFWYLVLPKLTVSTIWLTKSSYSLMCIGIFLYVIKFCIKQTTMFTWWVSINSRLKNISESFSKCLSTATGKQNGWYYLRNSCEYDSLQSFPEIYKGEQRLSNKCLFNWIAEMILKHPGFGLGMGKTLLQKIVLGFI